MNILKNNLIVGLFFAGAIFYILVSKDASAALGTFEADIPEISAGDQIEVRFFIDTQGEDINAVEGTISFPASLFKIEEVHEGNSTINFWIEKPDVIMPCSDFCSMYFSGIIPGGYNSMRGLLFSFVLKAIAEGEGKIMVQNMKALLNDGNGTQTLISVEELALRVSPNTSGISHTITLVEDTDKPEFFTPLITQDINIFDGKYFLVFATQDKSSGISGYSIYERRNPKIERSGDGVVPLDARWGPMQSPYLLEDQELRSYIFVKAADKAGNERIVMLSPEYPLKLQEFSKEKVIIMGMAISVLILLFGSKKIKKGFIKI